jgi:hypothetical protein
MEMKAWWPPLSKARALRRDNRNFFLRLLLSIRPSLARAKGGVTFWMKGGADF